MSLCPDVESAKVYLDWAWQDCRGVHGIGAGDHSGMMTVRRFLLVCAGGGVPGGRWGRQGRTEEALSM